MSNWHARNPPFFKAMSILQLRDHPLKTSANFHYFWPLPPSGGSFLLLSIDKFDHFLTLPPLQIADVINGWSMDVATSQKACLDLNYRRVPSSNTSHLEPYLAFTNCLWRGFLMLNYVLWPFNKKKYFLIINTVNTRDFAVDVLHTTCNFKFTKLRVHCSTKILLWHPLM